MIVAQSLSGTRSSWRLLIGDSLSLKSRRLCRLGNAAPLTCLFICYSRLKTKANLPPICLSESALIRRPSCEYFCRSFSSDRAVRSGSTDLWGRSSPACIHPLDVGFVYSCPVRNGVARRPKRAPTRIPAKCR